MEVVNNVIIGRDGWLYLSSDRHFTLDLMLGNKKINNRCFENFSANIDRRRRLSTGLKSKYLHLIAPDKHVVIDDKFPIENFIALGSLYRENTMSNFIYPVQELKSSELPCYLRTDTHWSAWGQTRVAIILARSFGFSELEIEQGDAILRKNLKQNTKPFVGDLGVKLTPQQSEESQELIADWGVHSFSNGLRGGNDGRIVATYSRSPISRGRLVIFGDSFMAQAQSALTIFFREILFCRTRFFHHEIVVGARPDFVLTQNVERYLSSVQSDIEATPMLLMAEMNGKATNYAPQHAAAVGAMLSGKNRCWQNFVASIDGD